jgi:hypothetical protein
LSCSDDGTEAVIIFCSDEGSEAVIIFCSEVTISFPDVLCTLMVCISLPDSAAASFPDADAAVISPEFSAVVDSP